MSLVLHGYWRSSASYRVRIALHLKHLAFDQTTHDLRQGAQRNSGFLALAPQGLVPALDVDGVPLVQSLAILEWLEETHPAPPLLPQAPVERAVVRAMAAIIACDIHPLGNLRVLQQLRGWPGVSEEQIRQWTARWISEGFAALEQLVLRHGDGFCFGNAPTMADCCLVPQMYNARRFAVDLSPFPALLAIDARCADIEAFAKAAPEQQPDADAPDLSRIRLH